MDTPMSINHFISDCQIVNVAVSHERLHCLLHYHEKVQERVVGLACVFQKF